MIFDDVIASSLTLKGLSGVGDQKSVNVSHKQQESASFQKNLAQLCSVFP